MLAEDPMTPDLPDAVADQARELFSHLPAGEIGDDDPLDFTVIEGRLWARHDGAVYRLAGGAAWRITPVPGDPDRVDVTAWRDGRRLGRAVVAADFDPEAGAPWS